MKKTLVAALLALGVAAPASATVHVDKNRIVCEYEAGIRAIAAMKDLKRIRKMPDSCRVLEVKRFGDVVRIKGVRYVKIKTKLGDDFYTLTESVDF